TEYELAWERPGAVSTNYTVRHIPYPAGELQPQGYYLLLTTAVTQSGATPAAAPRSAVPRPGSGGGAEAAAGTAGDTSQLGAEGGESLYLRSMTDDLMGWNDPRAKLSRALEENQFLLFAQKILALKSGLADPSCMEILLRLQEEEDNFLPPGGFLPLAERYGMMEDLDRWVVRNVISWCLKRMRKDPDSRLPLCCVNLSEASVKSLEFAPYVMNELQIAGLPARTLCFEIGEQDAINHHAYAQRLIAALKPAGCLHTIDAFGSTKVTFSYLKGLPIDFLKIDGNIIQYILRDSAELAKAKAINTVCQKVGVRSIAEFVESKETLGKLREIGMDYVQGFGIARPEPISKLS
ncbi:MAG TPA: EAL domain-containing protein, partial [Burkholderiales bacterium]|nr:EAL domain-containing protein [Burkholderiales bacterium]